MAFPQPKRYYQNSLRLFHLIERILTKMQLHRATGDKVLEGVSTNAWGLPRSASEQEWISRGEILHVSEHVRLGHMLVRELQDCYR